MNNFKHVAENVGRMPKPELCSFLTREGVVNKNAVFRPARVDAAIDFLLANNVIYAKEWEGRQRVRFSKGPRPLDYEQNLDEDMFMQMDAEEGKAVEHMSNEEDVLASSESDFVLFHTDRHVDEEPLTRDDHIRTNLEASPMFASTNNGPRSFHIPRPDTKAGDDSLVKHPSKDNLFYEKCFPCLFPYGVGGPNSGNHHIKFEDYVKVVLKRGGSPDARRFGKYVPFMLAVYSYKMKKISGGVAYVASTNVEASGHSTVGPSGEGGDARGSDSSLLHQIQTAPDAKSILEALYANKGELSHKILRRLEPYAERLVGSPAFIMHERKLLFAMLGSHVVREDGVPGIFSTIAPNDRWYPELPDILKRGDDKKETYTKAERVRMLRDHPVLAARLFEIRSRLFFFHVMCGEGEPLGKISDWWMRLEFQGEKRINNNYMQSELIIQSSSIESTD